MYMHVRYHILSHLIYLVYQGLFPTKLSYLQNKEMTTKSRETESKFKLSTIENPRYTYFSQ